MVGAGALAVAVAVWLWPSANAMEVTPSGLSFGALAVGDQVPGYGRVNAIVQQKGGAWIVQCDRGTIQ